MSDSAYAARGPVFDAYFHGDDEALVAAIRQFLSVLTDGVQVTGDVMNLCARIAASAEPGQIRVSHDCFRELDNLLRLRCRPLGDVQRARKVVYFASQQGRGAR